MKQNGAKKLLVSFQTYFIYIHRYIQRCYIAWVSLVTKHLTPSQLWRAKHIWFHPIKKWKFGSLFMTCHLMLEVLVEDWQNKACYCAWQNMPPSPLPNQLSHPIVWWFSLMLGTDAGHKGHMLRSHKEQRNNAKEAFGSHRASCDTWQCFLQLRPTNRL